jgi:hypothetical protein
LKLQVFAFSVAFIVVILTSSLVTVPSVRAQQISSESTTLRGTLPLIGPISFDLCKIILFGLVSCSLSLTVAEVYKQNITLQIQDTPNELQVGMTANTGVTLSTDRPVQVLDLNFTYGNHNYTFPVPLPSAPVPGVYPVTIPISSILAKILTGPIIGTIFSSIAAINLNLNFTSEIQGVLSSKGFDSTQQTMMWETPSTDATSSKLIARIPDASISLTSLNATLGLSADLVLKLFSLVSINLLDPTYLPLLQLGSSTTPISLGDWYEFNIQSAYSQTSGSGWYLAGTQATFSVADTTVATQGGNYMFTGWTGTGPESYGGTQASESITANGPTNETANWSPVENSKILGLLAWTVGIATAVGLIAILVVVAIVVRKPRRL